MLLDDFSKMSYGLGTAQFACGLALDQLGCHAACKAVIVFMTVEAKRYSIGHALSDEEIMSVLDERDALEAELHNKRNGLIFNLIQKFYSEKCLSSVSIKDNVSVKRKVTIRELVLNRIGAEELYSRTMSILRRNTPNSLIVAFIDTKEFRNIFNTTIRVRLSMSADNYRANDLNDNVLNELLARFTEDIKNHSANGTYRPHSGAPSAYLRNCLTSFFLRNTDNYLDVLNRVFTNTDVGGDGSDLTNASIGTLEYQEKSDDINFIDVVNKIYNTSKILFTHSNSSTPFYDILTLYRDNKLNLTYKESIKNKKAFSGLKFETDDVAATVSGNYETIKNKFRARSNIANVFMPIVDSGLSQDEILLYYEKAMLVNEEYTRNGPKDAQAIFSTSTVSIKDNYSNSQKLQIIISGMLALRELVQYLDRKDTCATLFNLRPLIFRDNRFHRRFQTIQEYVQYVDEVSALVSEVSRDTERSKTVIDGNFHINDDVWAALFRTKAITDEIYNKLIDEPLTAINSAVKVSNQESRGCAIAGRQSLLKNTVYNAFAPIYDGENSVFRKGEHGIVPVNRGYNPLAVILHNEDAIKNGFRNDEWNYPQLDMIGRYVKAIELFLALKFFLLNDGRPFVDGTGMYCYVEPDSAKELKRPGKVVVAMREKQSTDKFYQSYAKLTQLQTMLASRLYYFFTGEKPSVKDAHGISHCSWQELRTLFAVGEELTLYSYGLYKALQKLVYPMTANTSADSTLFLNIGYMATNPQIFKVPTVVSSANELSFLYQGIRGTLYLADNIFKLSDGTTVYGSEVNEWKDHRIVMAHNRLAACLDTVGLSALSEGFSLLDATVDPSCSSIGMTNAKLAKLYEYCDKATRTSALLKFGDNSLRSYVVGRYSVNEKGLLCNEKGPLCMGNRFYMACGVVIDLGDGAGIPSLSAITEEDRRFLLM